MMEQISIFDLLETKETESRFTHEVRRGSGFADGKVRIYFANLKMDIKQLAVFLKDEYGVGGHSADFPDGGSGFTDYNPKGLMIREWKTDVTEKHTWPEVAKEVKRLISMDDYLSPKDWQKVKDIQRRDNDPVPRPRLCEEGWVKAV